MARRIRTLLAIGDIRGEVEPLKRVLERLPGQRRDCDSLEAVPDAMGELFEADRWVSVGGITSAGLRRRGGRDPAAARRTWLDVEETARSGNALMVKATRV